jgi:alpha-tubulin suppressor-like RCC1 family protein
MRALRPHDRIPTLRRFALLCPLVLLAACGDAGPSDPTLPGPQYATLTVGTDHACALDEEGRAFCWGDNLSGQLGAGVFGGTAAGPVRVVGGHRFVAIDADYGRTCGLTLEGQLYCWGGPIFEDPTWEPDSVPTLVDDTREWTAVTVGAYVCALDEARVAYCNELPGAFPPTNLGALQPVAGEWAWQSFSVGGGHVCGVTFDGRGHCWGTNWHGQLGVPSDSIDLAAEPIEIATLSGWLDIHAGFNISCGIREGDDRLFCWGYNEFGELGDPAGPYESNEPIEPRVGLAASALALAGSGWDTRNVSCADFEQIGWACWGEGIDVTAIAMVSHPWQFVDAGANQACGLTTRGRVYCWGQLWGSEATLVIAHPAAVELPRPGVAEIERS